MRTHTLGFPRMGRERELKWALEAHWRGELDEAGLAARAAELRAAHWRLQLAAGMAYATAGDFSLYDHMLDAAVLLGAVPERFSAGRGEADAPHDVSDVELAFRMARGDARANLAAMEMTKWFDTNYHYIVPEFTRATAFAPRPARLLAEAGEAAAVAGGAAAANGLGAVKIALPGPLTFLSLGKGMEGAGNWDKWALFDDLLAAYAEVVRAVAPACGLLQLDEPVLATDLDRAALERFRPAYETLVAAAGDTPVLLATYFGPVDHNLRTLAELPVAAVHLDLVRGPAQLPAVLDALDPSVAVSLGLVDGRNVWRARFDPALDLLRAALARRSPEQVLVAPSCSLLHVPMDLEPETELAPEVRRWMAFAAQKCREVRALADLAVAGPEPDAALARELEDNRAAWRAREASGLTRDPAVRARQAAVDDALLRRPSPYAVRREAQRERLHLPPLPTTTIGSYPQTPEIRRARREFKSGALDEAAYKDAMRAHIADCVRRQEAAGLDVLVHGEPERNDMVEYFGELLDGFCFTRHGWVQSYGSRCVKPPVIFGDVSRPGPMTVEWASHAASLTPKPMKGMLTGPVTILCWSFVRDDQPRSETCAQIGLAIRDEVADLEAAGLPIVQIDEPALREGLPLRRADWDAYLRWAVDCFRLATSGAADATQIHTHMCYAEFNDIIEAIAAMDADVISIEASRSNMELLRAFARFRYPNEVGPGVWDIHSPRVPSKDEMLGLLRRAAEVLPADRLWVNPDCGLKTRQWPETEASLANLVAAARALRAELGLA
ncbi:MAG: 5-methyltetrahydropteroyltriglutamate--homocysteine S-methyltransferase [Desulfovibrionaceae bacterium]|nr:5-methyltetrahydropteroyltriglutamate--homocysteine S-methyltransferase [Desulfovibrionaceae bacterium]